MRGAAAAVRKLLSAQRVSSEDEAVAGIEAGAVTPQ